MKKVMSVLSFLLFALLLTAIPAAGQEKARSWPEVIAKCPTITVGEVQSADNDTAGRYGLNRNYGQRARQREAIRRSRGYGGGYGYGAYGGYGGSGYPGIYSGIYNRGNYPVYSTLDPAGKLPPVIQTLLSEQLEALGANMLAPATGPDSAKFQVLEAEANVGRDAGKYGSYTWETAACVVTAQISIQDETVESGGFDGTGPGYVTRTIAWRTRNQTASEVLDALGAGVSTVQKHKQERRVSATLRVQVFDLSSRRAVFGTSGTDRVYDDRNSFFSVLGYYKSEDKFPNPELLAKSVVAAAFGQKIK